MLIGLTIRSAAARSDARPPPRARTRLPSDTAPTGSPASSTTRASSPGDSATSGSASSSAMSCAQSGPCRPGRSASMIEPTRMTRPRLMFLVKSAM